MTTGICLIGAGRIGTIHADNIADEPSARILYVVDADEAAATSLAKRCGAKVSRLEQALGDPAVDAVLIASSTDTHVELMRAASDAGKAVFCEKPVDLDLVRAQDCIRDLEGRGTLLALGFNRRYDPDFRELWQRVQAGAIGDIELVIITSRDPAPPPLDYLRRSGGLFMDMMIHDFDMARWLLGEDPLSLFASASCLVDPEIASLGDVDTALVSLKTASGKLCQISNSRRAVYGYDQRIEVHGSKGMLRAENRSASQIQCFRAGAVESDPPMDFFLERYAAAYRLELRAFLAALKGGEAPLVTGSDALKAQVLADAASRSYRENTLVYPKYGN
ncbi:inositol 2-dehydrogenase [Seongchinamella sediminis]|uniref:Inositol 2-dehydrogenase n=1 Tax=Seongchinamella sediminis TaxID=2283635 RepID=A0A3L7DVY2_9GAMM|nr:inositol 2-dehydrogenase [Seongchinamella sediminis]RLQ21738.1 inositol 2-dehydrogenase [Seongchinamella sediminis]